MNSVNIKLSLNTSTTTLKRSGWGLNTVHQQLHTVIIIVIMGIVIDKKPCKKSGQDFICDCKENISFSIKEQCSPHHQIIMSTSFWSMHQRQVIFCLFQSVWMSLKTSKYCRCLSTGASWCESTVSMILLSSTKNIWLVQHFSYYMYHSPDHEVCFALRSPCEPTQDNYHDQILVFELCPFPAVRRVNQYAWNMF